MRREIVVLTEHTCLEVEQTERYLLQHLNELEIAVVEERDCLFVDAAGRPFLWWRPTWAKCAAR